MKKIFILMASAALMLAASCNKMEEVNTPVDTPADTTVETPAETETITVQLNHGTKTSLGEEGTATIWSQGDAVDVTTGGTYLGTLYNNSNLETFSGEIKAGTDGGKNITLYYPSGSNGSAPIVPDVQDAVENSFAEGAAVLEGYTTMADLRAGKPVTMKNMTALLKFSVARDGDVTFNVGEDTYTITGCNNTAATYYACIDPQESVALSYKLGDKTGAKSKENATFEAGKIYNLGTLIEVFVPQDDKLYLKSGNDWNVDDATFAAYFFEDESNYVWSKMDLVEGQSDIYVCTVPEGYSKVIFCRMDPIHDALVWDAVWNKTIDLSLLDGNVYTITDPWGAFDGDTASGEWSGNPVIEIPTVIPGEASEWALVGAFSSWVDKTMLTTEDANVVVLEKVSMKAAEGFLVRKPATDWADKYGAGNVNYLKANHYITTSKDGADMCLEADGTYDIYFNTSTKDIYVMAEGVAHSTATKQTVSGKEPVQEEPEVTEKVVYLKPNSNWKADGARFAAYFFNGATGEKWVSMTYTGSNDIYEVHLPEGYDYGCDIIFCRMNPSTTANNWNNKWNQTSDLKTPTDGKNLYTVKAGTWDKGGGTWSVK